jgi:hypothetical protein
MKQVTLSELAQQGNTDAIANLIKQLIATNANAVGVNSFVLNELRVNAELDDGRLSVNLIAPDALEPRKIVILIRSQLARLRLEFITRVKVYGWLKDSEQPEQRLTWNQEFKLEPPVKSPKYQSQIAMPAPLPRGIADHNSVNMSARPVVRSSGMAIANPLPSITSRSTDVPVQRRGRNNNNGNYPPHRNRVGGYSPVAGQVDHVVTNPHSSDTSPIDITNANSTHPSAPDQVVAKRKKSAKLPVQLIFVGIFIAIAGMGMGMGIRVLTARSQRDNVQTSQTQPDRRDRTDDRDPADLTGAIAEDTSATAPEDLKITLTEFEQINQGMTIEEVESIIGVPGKLIANSSVGEVTGQVYSWKNAKGSNAIIEFRNGKVVAKAQAGLS